MDRDFLRNTLLRARWQTAQLGAPGKIGFGLMIFSVVFFIVAVLPRRAESSALMGKAEAMKVLMQTKPAMAPGGKNTRRWALQAFYAFFPTYRFLAILDQGTGAGCGAAQCRGQRERLSHGP